MLETLILQDIHPPRLPSEALAGSKDILQADHPFGAKFSKTISKKRLPQNSVTGAVRFPQPRGIGRYKGVTVAGYGISYFFQ
jgi:hypothetical protein